MYNLPLEQCSRLARGAWMDPDERFRKVFDEGPLGIAVLDPSYRLVEVNGRLCDFLGYTRDELMNLTFPEFTHAEDISKDVPLAAKLFRGEIPSYQIEKRFIRKDGEIVWGLLHASVLHNDKGEPEYGLGMVEDITERKREFEELFDNQRDGVALVVEGRFSRVNARLVEMLGRSEEELVGTLASEMVSAEDRNRVLEMAREILSGTPPFPAEYDIDRPNASAISIEVLSRPVDYEGERAIVSLVRDVTELKSAKRALEESESRFRELAEDAGAGIVIIDETERFAYANPALRAMTGYTWEELEGMNAGEVVHPDQRETVREQILSIIRGDLEFETFRVRLWTKEGDERWLETTNRRIHFGGRFAVLGVGPGLWDVRAWGPGRSVAQALVRGVVVLPSKESAPGDVVLPR